VDEAADGAEADGLVRHNRYDAIVLDLMLPGRGGFDVLSAWRRGGVGTPVVILTARDEVDDRVRGLSLGADDYFVKPFAMEELAARLEAVVRRDRGRSDSRLRLGGLEIDLAGRAVRRGGQPVMLTAREFALLEKLSQLARADAAVGIKLEPVDLPASLREGLGKFGTEIAGKNLHIDRQVTDGPFKTDPVLWRAIVTNLLGNSVAYAPDGTTVAVRATPHSFSVSNEAPDLDPGDVEFLFDRFWRKSSSRTQREHSGLGLSVVKASIELLGGSCRAALDDGKLTISVHWPT